MSAGDLPSRRWRSQADIGWMLGKLTLQKVISPSTIFLAQRTTKTYYIWQPKIGVTNTIHYGSCSLLIQSCVQLGSCRSVLARAWRASLRKRHPPQASVEHFRGERTRRSTTLYLMWKEVGPQRCTGESSWQWRDGHCAVKWVGRKQNVNSQHAQHLSAVSQWKWSDYAKVAKVYATFMQNLVKHVDVLTQGLKSGISGLMNLTSQATESASGVNFVNFNQDCT